MEIWTKRVVGSRNIDDNTKQQKQKLLCNSASDVVDDASDVVDDASDVADDERSSLLTS